MRLRSEFLIIGHTVMILLYRPPPPNPPAPRLESLHILFHVGRVNMVKVKKKLILKFI